MTPPRRRYLLRFLALGALLLAAPATAQAPPAPDLSLLAEAGAEFPETLGVFVRSGYNSVQRGRIDAHYVVPGGQEGSPILDLYLARTDRTPAVELKETEAMVAMIYGELQAVRDLAVPAAAGDAAGRLWRATQRGEPVYTAMMISRRGAWRIKARATWSQAQGDKGLDQVERALGRYAWWGRSRP